MCRCSLIRQNDLSKWGRTFDDQPINSLKTIARYIEAKKPKTLDEAEHMLDLISVIADETIREIEAEPPYGLSAGALAKFDERIATLAEAIAR